VEDERAESVGTVKQFIGCSVPSQLADGRERLAADAFESGGVIQSARQAAAEHTGHGGGHLGTLRWFESERGRRGTGATSAGLLLWFRHERHRRFIPDELSSSRMNLESTGMPRREIADPVAAKIGLRIRALREEQGLTQEKLAYEGGLSSKGHLSGIEKGLVRPTIATLVMLAERLQVDLLDLFTFPEDSARQRLVDLTRQMKPGTVRRLVRDAAE
jgi:transcriptional regulator with XRE-family HTH domain